MTQRTISSEYMYWAKTHSAAKYNLAISDISHYPLSEIPFTLDGLPITGSGGYGYPPLLEAIGGAYGVPPASVVTSFGTSMANHIAMAAAIEPGDEVLVEFPTYELILSTAKYLGASVRRVQRRLENGFRIDADEVRRSISPKTKLVILTNLHNPSSAYTDEATMREIGKTAALAGANVLVDEVYLDAAFSKNTRSSFHLGDQFIVTSSLTKVYGLSGLRCGWIFANPALAKKMWRLIDLFNSSPVHISELISLAVFSDRQKVLKRSKALLETNGRLIREFLASRSDLRAPEYEHGLVVFPKVSADAEKLCSLLRETYETSIVPGRFFEMPEHIRIGIGREHAVLEAGLRNIGKALGTLAAP
ncbi:MAG TPA: aminotransferase class I/II-fold pyridoxal phosphate-dependent enzyme [Bacteroidota bacterium]|nr:aminotransferase class I/II-fold pyridoxal phosphate-dependent enzyme [Bacteroidota bacterium]